MKLTRRWASKETKCQSELGGSLRRGKSLFRIMKIENPIASKGNPRPRTIGPTSPSPIS